jgi:hypothetical protein
MVLFSAWQIDCVEWVWPKIQLCGVLVFSKLPTIYGNIGTNEKYYNLGGV